MTNPAPTRQLPGMLQSPRTLAVWGLLGFTALALLFAFFAWILPGGTFAIRSAQADFVDLSVMWMPVAAVLLAIHVAPALSGARLVAAIALIEYAVSLVFGTLAFLIGLGAVFDGLYQAREAFNVLAYVFLGLGQLALVAIAAYAVYHSFTSVGGRFSLGGPASSTD